LVLIAESDLHNPRLVRPPALGGYGLDAFWADDFHHAVHRFLTGEQHGYYADFDGLADIARALREGYVYQGQFAPSRQRGHGRPPGVITPDQLVFCIQNHDQTGNRAAGDRLGSLLSEEKLKAAAALLLLAPQVPLLFQGEEWGARTPFLYFTDHTDPALRQAVSEGRRREFPGEQAIADPQDPDTYHRSQLDWNEAEAEPHARVLAWYRELIRLRRGIAGAACEVRCDEAARWLTLDRGNVFAVFNFSREARTLPRPPGDWRLMLSSDGGMVDGAEEIPAGATAIYRRDEATAKISPQIPAGG
jgi:maltooligosyltrehalose trehalohydrolase